MWQPSPAAMLDSYRSHLMNSYSSFGTQPESPLSGKPFQHPTNHALCPQSLACCRTLEDKIMNE